MIGFSKLGSYGRLGNQLFQIASTMGIASTNKTTAAFPNWRFEHYFENQLPHTKAEFPFIHHERNFTYSPVILTGSDNVDLEGYFQCEKYFNHIEKQVRKQFKFKKEVIATAAKYLPEDNLLGLCSIHVRRGDYVDNPNYYQVALNYYIAAMKEMPEGLRFLVFSDDVDWCEENFPKGKNIIIMPPLTEILTLVCMSLCSYHIIANSSFSWWGAWLAKSKKVIAPHKWNAGELLSRADDKDIVPDGWTRLSPYYPIEKKALLDVTFTIPIRIDHPDRLENLNTCIDFLNKYFDTHIMVYESDNYSKYNPDQSVVYKFVKSSLFHRTRLLNQMASHAGTPIIVNWDADVFINPDQIYKSVQKIRDGEADAVYPYDGRFIRINRKHLSGFQEVMHTEYFRGLKVSAGDLTTISVGGAIMWNREKYFEIGGENERFIDYGPEDRERFIRASKLCNVARVAGPLFHINHNIASQNHENLIKNNIEYQRISAMSADQLKKEVATWPLHV